jgi:hypothetical protein
MTKRNDPFATKTRASGAELREAARYIEVDGRTQHERLGLAHTDPARHARWVAWQEQKIQARIDAANARSEAFEQSNPGQTLI